MLDTTARGDASISGCAPPPPRATRWAAARRAPATSAPQLVPAYGRPVRRTGPVNQKRDRGSSVPRRLIVLLCSRDADQSAMLD